MKRLILTRDEIYRAEELARDAHRIPMLTLMENAGRTAAATAAGKLGRMDGRRVLVVAGKGNNGGDGFVAARYLFTAGCRVEVYYLGLPGNYTELSFTNFDILHKMGVAARPLDGSSPREIEAREADLLVDAVFGIGVKSPIRELEQAVIHGINANPVPVLSLDIPSGLDANTGEIHGAVVKAETTVAFGFLKKGFYAGQGPRVCGEIILADIGYPPEIYENIADCGVRNAE